MQLQISQILDAAETLLLDHRIEGRHQHLALEGLLYPVFVGNEPPIVRLRLRLHGPDGEAVRTRIPLASVNCHPARSMFKSLEPSEQLADSHVLEVRPDDGTTVDPIVLFELHAADGRALIVDMRFPTKLADDRPTIAGANTRRGNILPTVELMRAINEGNAQADGTAASIDIPIRAVRGRGLSPKARKLFESAVIQALNPRIQRYVRLWAMRYASGCRAIGDVDEVQSEVYQRLVTALRREKVKDGNHAICLLSNVTKHAYLDYLKKQSKQRSNERCEAEHDGRAGPARRGNVALLRDEIQRIVDESIGELHGAQNRRYLRALALFATHRGRSTRVRTQGRTQGRTLAQLAGIPTEGLSDSEAGKEFSDLVSEGLKRIARRATSNQARRSRMLLTLLAATVSQVTDVDCLPDEKEREKLINALQKYLRECVLAGNVRIDPAIGIPDRMP